VAKAVKVAKSNGRDDPMPEVIYLDNPTDPIAMMFKHVMETGNTVAGRYNQSELIIDSELTRDGTRIEHPGGLRLTPKPDLFSWVRSIFAKKAR